MKENEEYLLNALNLAKVNIGGHELLTPYYGICEVCGEEIFDVVYLGEVCGCNEFPIWRKD